MCRLRRIKEIQARLLELRALQVGLAPECSIFHDPVKVAVRISVESKVAALEWCLGERKFL
jgi:hypothetical protein